MDSLNAMELYQTFETLHGAIDENWLAAAKTLSFLDVQTAVKSITFFNAANTKNIGDLSAVLTKHEQPFFQAFAVYATSSEKFLTDILGSSQQQGKIIFNNPIGHGTVNCNISVCSTCSGPTIFLRITINNEPLYIIQENFAAEAIYFPLRNAVIFFEGFLEPTVKLERLLVEILRHGKGYSHYFTRQHRNWGGLCYGHQSPFHFFYFQYPGLTAAFSGCRLDAPNLYSFENQHYLNAPNALGLKAHTTLFSNADQLRQEIFSKQIFIFNLGLRTHVWRNNKLKVRLMDTALVDYAKKNYDPSRVLNNIRQDFDFVVWIGVTSGKRIWREENEAALLFIRQLSKLYKKVLVVIDGWTSVLNQAPQNALYSADHESAELIKAATPENVHCVSVVGADPLVKIYYADNIDFFVSNHATGSLFVSRMCRKLGVTHISNSARAAAQSQHIHWESELVPKNIVHDIIEEDGQDVFYVSYSINPNEFVDFAMSVLKNKKPNWH